MMPVLNCVMIFLSRSYLSEFDFVCAMFRLRFGRSKPRIVTNGSRSASVCKISSLTSGVAVAVSATTCGRSNCASASPSRM